MQVVTKRLQRVGGRVGGVRARARRGEVVVSPRVEVGAGGVARSRAPATGEARRADGESRRSDGGALHRRTLLSTGTSRPSATTCTQATTTVVMVTPWS